VIPSPQGFLLQVARDLAQPVAKRLAMFVLRSKVNISDESDAWAQYGVWDIEWEKHDVDWNGDVVTVRAGERRFLQIGPVAQMNEPANADEVQWTLQEIRAGRPLITGATQDQFVPQMVNFEALGGVDFRKAAIRPGDRGARPVPRPGEAPHGACARAGRSGAAAGAGL